MIEKIPAALFDEFEDALDLGTPLSTGRISLHLIDPKTAKTAAAKTGKGTTPAPRPSPADVTVSLSGHNHDAAYAAAIHDNTSHAKKYFSRTNLIMKANPDTTLDAGHYWVKIQLSLPVGFTPGTSN